jgi:hypothetical protein
MRENSDNTRTMKIAGQMQGLPAILQTGREPKFMVDDWMTDRFLVRGGSAAPLMRMFTRKGDEDAMVVFHDLTHWEGAGPEPVATYAHALNAGEEKGSQDAT